MMAACLEEAIAVLTEKNFPLARVRRRSNEDPWITKKIRRLWKKKIRLYRRGGKCNKRHKVDRTLQTKIENAKAYFFDKLMEKGGSGKSFYSATKKLAVAMATPPWTINDMFIGMEAGEICDRVLDFFGGIAGAGEEVHKEGPRQGGGLPHFTAERIADLLNRTGGFFIS